MRKQIHNIDAERLMAYWIGKGRVWIRQADMAARTVVVRLEGSRRDQVAQLADIDWQRKF